MTGQNGKNMIEREFDKKHPQTRREMIKELTHELKIMKVCGLPPKNQISTRARKIIKNLLNIMEDKKCQQTQKNT